MGKANLRENRIYRSNHIHWSWVRPACILGSQLRMAYSPHHSDPLLWRLFRSEAVSGLWGWTLTKTIRKEILLRFGESKMTGDDRKCSGSLPPSSLYPPGGNWSSERMGRSSCCALSLFPTTTWLFVFRCHLKERMGLALELRRRRPLCSCYRVQSWGAISALFAAYESSTIDASYRRRSFVGMVARTRAG